MLVKKILSNSCREVETFERVVSLKVCDILFENTYMPCEDGSISSFR